MKAIPLLCAVLLAWGVGLLASSSGHDFEIKEPNAFLDLVVEPAEDQQATATAEFVVRSVIDQYRLWEPLETITVCFFGGSQEMRNLFVDVGGTWDKLASISFDFGASPFRNCSSEAPSMIRVSFDKNVPNSSLVGTSSRDYDTSKASLNIRPVGVLSPAAARALGGTILHELGHALGMKHEHQSPEAHCEQELNWPLVYEELAQPPNKMDKATVDHNMRQFAESKRLRVSEYDPTSIMHYSLPAEWFLEGAASTCFVPKNYALSDLDESAIKEMYPASAQGQDRYLEGLELVSGAALARLELSDDQLKQIKGEINAILGSVPQRNMQSKVDVTVGDIKSMGDCSPVQVGDGDMHLECKFNAQ